MKDKHRGYVLVVDDNQDICDLLSHLLQQAGYQTQQTYDGDSALTLLAQREPSVLLLDNIIPGASGMEVLAHAHAHYPQLPVIVITGNGGILGAVCAMKAGAWDYIAKPFENSRVLELVNRAVQTRGGVELSDQSSQVTQLRIANTMGNSADIQALTKNILCVAQTDFSVIIQGETGTGKELIANNLHLASKRADAVFIPLDCGAIPDTLIENELFGHEKGSYTGADQQRTGKFEAAEGGTLFLDEIANMPLPAQSKLLRVLQERVIYRVGGHKPIPVNVRVVAASNENLLDAVVNGSFREDLYYRLNEFVLRISPLRQRPEDILFLAKRFMNDVCVELGKPPLKFSPVAIELLTHYQWPGNVRELRAVIRRAALMAETEIGLRELNLHSPDPTPVETVSPSAANGYLDFLEPLNLQGKSLKEIKQLNTDYLDRVIISNMLKQTEGNKAETARRLQIDYKTLLTKIKRFSD